MTKLKTGSADGEAGEQLRHSHKGHKLQFYIKTKNLLFV